MRSSLLLFALLGARARTENVTLTVPLGHADWRSGVARTSAQLRRGVFCIALFGRVHDKEPLEAIAYALGQLIGDTQPVFIATVRVDRGGGGVVGLGLLRRWRIRLHAPSSSARPKIPRAGVLLF